MQTDLYNYITYFMCVFVVYAIDVCSYIALKCWVGVEASNEIRPSHFCSRIFVVYAAESTSIPVE